MSKRTLTKVARTYEVIKTGKKVAVKDVDEKGVMLLTALGEPQFKIVDETIVLKRETPLLPTPRERVEIEWEGIKMSVLVSPGQHINKYKEYKREMKRRELAYKNQ